VDTATILENINSFNYWEIEEFLNKNRQSFKREEEKRKNAACREHIAKHNIKEGDWFIYTFRTQDYSGNQIVHMYELQVKKINRTCVKATGYTILPKHSKIDYQISVPILCIKP